MTSNGENRYNPASIWVNYRTFLRAGKRLSRNTIKNYMSDLYHFTGWLKYSLNSSGGNAEVNLESVDSNLIDKYKSYLIKSLIPPVTVNRRLSSLRQFFDYCQKEGVMHTNPAREIANLPKIPAQQPVIATFLDRSNLRVKDDIIEFMNILAEA